jgi:hypothetical protein
VKLVDDSEDFNMVIGAGAAIVHICLSLTRKGVDFHVKGVNGASQFLVTVDGDDSGWLQIAVSEFAAKCLIG